MSSHSTNNVRLSFGFLLAAVGLVGLGLIFVLHGVLNPDEGFYLAAARFVADGKLPYRDFGYTQGPVLPYVNQLWLHVYGFSLGGQRLASFTWTLLAAGAGALWLGKKGPRGAATAFLVLLLGAPLWLAFSVEGKTYGFAGLMVLVGAIAVVAEGRWVLRWGIFLVAAILGMGARYPMAGFFLPAGVGLLVLAPDRRSRIGGGLIAALVLAGGLAIFVRGGNGDRFFFWTIGFHRASTFRIPVWRHFTDCFRFAPALWISTAVTVWSLRRRLRSLGSPAEGGEPADATREKHATQSHVVVLVGLLIALVTNLSASTTYAEYVFPFFPAMALVVAPLMATASARLSRPWIASAGLLALAAGWNYPPEFSRDLLAHAAQAESFLRASVPAGATVACSMPEIPIAAGCQVPLSMAMGKFGITDGSADKAESRRMLTPAVLRTVLEDPSTKAFVGSSAYNWNFFWSLPSYRVLSAEARAALWVTLREHYAPAFMNAEYVVYLRKKRTE